MEKCADSGTRAAEAGRQAAGSYQAQEGYGLGPFGGRLQISRR